MSLTGPEETSTLRKAEDNWVLSDLYQANGISRDPWKAAVLGASTLFQNTEVGYACAFSKAQTSAIICADLFDAMAIVR